MRKCFRKWAYLRACLRAVFGVHLEHVVRHLGVGRGKEAHAPIKVASQRLDEARSVGRGVEIEVRRVGGGLLTPRFAASRRPVHH